jgi:fatty-acyl-CoA synthase
LFTSSSDKTAALSYTTIIEALRDAPHEKPFATMWRSEDDVESVTFGEFRQRAEAFSALLQEYGAGPGDKVILIMPQGISLMAGFAGAMTLGAVPAILAYPNFKTEPAKYRHGLSGVARNLKAPLVLVDSDFPDHLFDCFSDAEGTQFLRCRESELLSARLAATFLPSPEDIAFIQHSAGTTGLQKGVALTHGAVLRQLGNLAEALLLTEDDRICSWLPLYHDMGLITSFVLPLVYHLPVVMQSPTDWVMQPGTMLELITENQSTLAWVPNFALQLLARRVRQEDRAGFNLRSLRALVNCSEPVRSQSLDEFLTSYSLAGLQPGALQSSYAMAENVFAVTQSSIGSPPERIWVDGETLREQHIVRSVLSSSPGAVCFVSSGRCIPGNQVRVMSADDEALEDGSIGELAISSDSLFDGYHNRPDLTDPVLCDGWFWTGDLGFCLNGEVFVVGRKKDLIIVGGKNIYPQDVEEIVSSHPAIHDGRAVSMGVYNTDLGTEDIVIVAEVEREESLTNSIEIERAIKALIIAELGVAARSVYLKPPRWIVKSTAGKPARAATREKMLEQHQELTEGTSTGGMKKQ